MNLKRQLSLLALAMVIVSPVAAQSSDDWQTWPTGKRWSIGAGYFSPNLDTKIIVTDENQIVGTGISFEENLGLDDSEATGLLYINWRMFERHALEYRYFKLDRSATTSSSSVAIAIGEEFFDVTLPIQSFFDITAHEIAYSYSLMFDERKDLYVGLGISLQDLGLGIQGTESSPNPGEVIVQRSRISSPASSWALAATKAAKANFEPTPTSSASAPNASSIRTAWWTVTAAGCAPTALEGSARPRIVSASTRATQVATMRRSAV